MPVPDQPTAGSIIRLALADASHFRRSRSRTIKRKRQTANLALSESYLAALRELESGRVSVIAGSLSGALTLGGDLAALTLAAVQDAIRWQQAIIQAWDAASENDNPEKHHPEYSEALRQAERYRGLAQIIVSAVNSQD
jgi:hypothetical protein